MDSSAASLELSAQEWKAIVEYTPEPCRRAVADCVRVHAPLLVDYFYEHLIEHPQAAPFLQSTAVQDRLRLAMKRWLIDLFNHSAADVQQQIAAQRQVGAAHLRIGLPARLVVRGARVLKICLHNLLSEQLEQASLLLTAQSYSHQLIDLALEIMCADEAFSTGHGNGADSTDGSGRGQRQRAELFDWHRAVLFALHRVPAAVQLPGLAESGFGLWFAHKAPARFADAPEIQFIRWDIERIDDTLAALAAADLPAQRQHELLTALQTRVDDVALQLDALFEREAVNGAAGDRPVRLISQRQPAEPSDEDTPRFATLVIDIDHFRTLDPHADQEARDLLLQQALALIQACVRSDDAVLRYGSDELMVMLENITSTAARMLAERIRADFEAQDFLLGDGLPTQVTVCLGLALFDDRPDYAQMAERADAAMRQAKQLGRNQICEV